MAINRFRPSHDASSSTRQVGSDSAESTPHKASGASGSGKRANPIGTGTAKLLHGDTQEQDNALQRLKYDAYDVYNKTVDYADLKADATASEADIAAAEAALVSAQTAYASELQEASGEGLTGGRIQRYLAGGAHPVPDNALIPSSDTDIEKLMAALAGMEDEAPAAAPAEAAALAPAAPKTTTSSATASTTAPGTLKNIDPKLTKAQQAALGDSQLVLSTATMSEQLIQNIMADSGVTRAVAEEAAVTSGPAPSFTLFPDGKLPSTDDVNQYKSDDCFYMSSLASMASTPEGQQLIRNAIAGPDPKTGDYVVTMHSPEGALVDIAVNPNNIPVSTDGTPAFSNGKDGGANWVNLMEAAYAKYNDAYKVNTGTNADGTENVTESGYDAIMMTGVEDTSFNFALTGNTGASVPTAGADRDALTLKMFNAMLNGQPVGAYNLDSADATANGGKASIVSSHAYAVVGISADGSQIMVKNPWGAHNPQTGQDETGCITMTIDEFYDNFEQVVT